MKYILLLVCVTATVAFKIVPYEQTHENDFSLNRQKRDTNVKIGSGHPGTKITASHSGNIINNNGHRLDGGAFVSKQFRPSGPTSVGGQLGYSHVPSGSNLNIGAQRTAKFGTNVGATGKVNLWSSGNHRLDAVGSYNRHYGGVGGTGHAGYFAGLEYKMKGLQ